jgi:two-component system cell cycle response regulator DivK
VTTKRRVLVVEDNLDNMTLISDVLLSLGYDPLIAKDGEEGIRLASAEKPDLILMDLSLPKMDGWTATRHLKADPDVKHIPVIALTAHAMLGCDDYISKPISLRELSEKLKLHIG